MLWSIALIMVLIWFVGMSSQMYLNGFIYVFLLSAVIAVVLQVLTQNRSAP